MGHIPQLAFARVVAIWDLIGPLVASEVQLEKEEHEYTFVLHAKGKDGENVIVQEHRRRDGRRGTVWSMTGTKGSTYVPQKREREDLFGMDLDRALQRIPSAVHISDIFGFLDQVHTMTYGNKK